MTLLTHLRAILGCLAFGHPVAGEKRLTHCPACGKLLRASDLPEGWR